MAEQLAGLRVLLVLDTCEHVLDACAELAETILGRCPDVTILATSRERLRCSGERIWQVPGLAPAESVELFLSRAATPIRRSRRPISGEIEELCARLEGMPLALEMAAARVPSFAPAQIAARLDQSLDILAGGLRTALTRQQTLRATISWSHDLLDGEERVLFRRLAVFAGSFSLDAAVEVCAGGAVEPGDVVSLLLRIVDKSLAVVEDAELARYRLLDTVRQFAEECLAAAGEREAVEARLGDWALAFTSSRRRSRCSSSTTTTCAPRSTQACSATHRARYVWPRTCGASGSTATTSPKARAGCIRCSTPRRRRPSCA